MLKQKTLTQTELFLDGLITPTVSQDYVITGSVNETFPFGDRTIGIKRYWDSRAVGAEITKLISVPFDMVSACFLRTGGIVEIQDFNSGETKSFYKVEQIQIKKDTVPPCMYLSLTNDAIQVTDRRDENGTDS